MRYRPSTGRKLTAAHNLTVALPPISVCIGSIRRDTVRHTLRAVLAQDYPGFAVTVVLQGDAPIDAELGALLGDPRVTVVRDDGRGASRARNIAAANAVHELLAFIDDDCIPDADWLRVIGSYFEAHPNLALLGGALVAPPRGKALFATCPQVIPGETLYDSALGKEAPGHTWLTANFAIRKDAWRAIGPLDEQLGAGSVLLGGEDIDYKIRAHQRGLFLATTPRSRVVHRYGWRYGLRTYMRLLSNYAFSTGAVAGKQQLADCRSGEAWRQHVRGELVRSLTRPYRLPRAYIRWRRFNAGYNAVLRDYELDSATGLLRRRGSAAPVSGNVGSAAPAAE